MSRKAIITTLIIVLSSIIILNVLCYHSDPALEGKSSHVVWSEVNLRSRPSTSSGIVRTLRAGAGVTFTGDVYIVIDNPYGDWVQVALPDGTTGWVVRDALK